MITQLIGLGTAVNVIAVLAGSGLGMLLGDRLGARVRSSVTDALGLLTLVIAGMSVVPLAGANLRGAVGAGATIVIVIAVLLGTVIGSALRLEDRIAGLGTSLRRHLVRRRVQTDTQTDTRRAEARFVDGFVTASLVFCVGPLTFLGAINEGLGRGADQLLVKSCLDFFAAMAFAASLGVGVMASVITVVVVQGGLTLAGWALGDVLPAAQIDALTVAGGVVLGGLGLRLLDLKRVRVADMLPGLVVAPVAVWLASMVV